MKAKHQRLALITALPLCFHAASAWAQAPAASKVADNTAQPGDIVVTAEKRTSTIQHTALAITAVAGDALAKKGVTSLESISTVAPAVSVNNEQGTVKINIRGLGLNSYGPGIEGNVATYINGIYIAHAAELGGQFLDVQRLEVLRGPQGTLYGRNSTGGAINIISNAPTNEMSAGLDLSYGNYNDVQVSGYVSGPVVPDVLKVRFAGQFERRDGFSYNAFNGDHYNGLEQGGFRVSAEYTPTEKLKLTLSADYSHGDDTSVVVSFAGLGRTQAYARQLLPRAIDQATAAAAVAQVTTVLPVAAEFFGGVTNALDAQGRVSNPAILYQDSKPAFTRTYWGGSAILEYQLSDAVTFKSLTGYRHGQYSAALDADVSTVNYLTYTQVERWHTITEEVQLLGSVGKLDWIVGGFYMNDQEPYATGISNLPAFDFIFGPYGSLRTSAYAAFAQLNYAFTPELKLTLGGRYGYENRHRTEFFDTTSTATVQPDKISFRKFIPKATLTYEPTGDLTFYATVSQGFKSGGFLLTAAQDPVQSEKLWDYEAGAKLRLFDRKLQINAAAYHYDYTNLQVPINIGNRTFTQNAAGAKINGGELEIIANPVSNFQLSAWSSIIAGKFTEYVTTNSTFPELGQLNLSGNQLPFVSKYTFSVSGDYTIPLANDAKVELSADYYWQSKRYFDSFNLDNAVQPSVGKLGARARYTAANGKWYIEGYGKNLTNEFIYTQTSNTGSTLGYALIGQRDAPRTYGVRVGISY